MHLEKSPTYKDEVFVFCAFFFTSNLQRQAIDFFFFFDKEKL